MTITCPDASVTFDGPDIEAGDYDDTYLVYEYFARVLGA